MGSSIHVFVGISFFVFRTCVQVVFNPKFSSHFKYSTLLVMLFVYQFQRANYSHHTLRWPLRLTEHRLVCNSLLSSLLLSLLFSYASSFLHGCNPSSSSFFHSSVITHYRYQLYPIATHSLSPITSRVLSFLSSAQNDPFFFCLLIIEGKRFSKNSIIYVETNYPTFVNKLKIR